MDRMLTPIQVDPGHKSSLNGSARAAVRAATNLLKSDRRAGTAALNAIFQAGLPPGPELDGRFMGELYIMNIAPILTMLAAWAAESWRPWKGKIFYADRHVGENVFSRNSLLLAYFVWPVYRNYKPDGPATYRAFPFVTRLGAGHVDQDRQVLKLDYDIQGNPGQSVRRVLDELVQVGHDFYLGKAHLQWWWGRWQQVAFFTLEKGGKTKP